MATKKVRFESAEQAQQRLNHCIISYAGIPHYVYEVRGEDDNRIRISLVKLPKNIGQIASKDIYHTYLDDPKFENFVIPELGYVNMFEKGVYSGYQLQHPTILNRVPVRRTAHGLNGNNVQISTASGGVRMQFLDFAASEGFVDAWQGRFPSFETAVNSLVNNSTIAVSKNFAVGLNKEGLPLFYKLNQMIGMWNPAEVRLLEKFAYLREEIMEEPNLPNTVGAV